MAGVIRIKETACTAGLLQQTQLRPIGGQFGMALDELVFRQAQMPRQFIDIGVRQQHMAGPAATSGPAALADGK